VADRRVGSAAPPPPLVGRADELGALTSWLEAEDPGGRLIYVEGEAGIGKSRLLDAALGALPAGVLVLRARGFELEREQPFGTILDLLGSSPQVEPGDRQQVIDAIDSASGSVTTLRFRVVEAVVALVEQLAAHGRVTLVVDDLQWVDESSILVLEQVARRLADRRVTSVLASRPSQRAELLVLIRGELTRAGVLHLRLGPLDDALVAQLATELLGATPGERLRSVLGGAAGNPFYVTELVAALLADGAVEVGDVAEVADVAAAASADVAIVSQLASLGARALDVLRMAAVLGSRFNLDDLSLVLDRPASELAGPIAELSTAGFVEPTGSSLAFRHDLVREAVYRDHPEPVLRAVHRQVAAKLRDARRPLAYVAPHLLAGASHGDRDAIDWLIKGADEAIARSPVIAAEMLAGAIALCPAEEPTRDELQVRLVEALTWSGRNAEAVELLDEIEARPHDPALAARLDLAAARALHLSAREREAVDRYERLAESPQLTVQERARVCADAASAAVMYGDLDGSERFAREAIDRASAIGDDPALCGGLSARSWIANVRGRTREAVALGDRAVELARGSADRETARRSPQGYQAVVLMDADRLEDGRQMFDEARRVAEFTGDRYLAPTYSFGQMLAEFHAGRLDDAMVSLEVAQAQAEELGVRSLIVWSNAVAARIAIRRGDLETASSLLDEADDEVQREGPRLGADWLLWCRGLLHEASGAHTEGRDMLAVAWELAEAIGLISHCRLIGPDLVRMLMHLGEVDRAAAVADQLGASAEEGGTHSARAVALRCQGLVERRSDPLLAAVAELRATPRALDLADTLFDASIHCEPQLARDLLGEALVLYERAGARRDEQAVNERLGSLGEAPRRRARREGFGWDALTPTEVEVARLAAQGLSNPEIARQRFVSPRTIETHLSNAYTKLGVTSRAALAAEVVRNLG
jgi:DNA-binding CsgD family transcriptional regulator